MLLNQRQQVTVKAIRHPAEERPYIELCKSFFVQMCEKDFFCAAEMLIRRK